MFNSSPNKVNPIVPDDKAPSEDFIVHNMPEANRFSGQTFSSAQPAKNNVNASSAQLSQHHKIGILIISGGSILIIFLIYLGYNFMIKPAAVTPPANTQITESSEKETTKEEPIVIAPPITAPVVR
jgi:hypothetical protein